MCPESLAVRAKSNHDCRQVTHMGEVVWACRPLIKTVAPTEWQGTSTERRFVLGKHFWQLTFAAIRGMRNAFTNLMVGIAPSF